ncbi:MAG: hypothetical protein AAFU64_04105, partial [Bacteroidota bacterium]
MKTIEEQLVFLVLGLVIVNIVFFVWVYRRGKKALSIFPDIQGVKVQYRDRHASGMAVKKRGYAKKNRLDVVVTEDELWLRTTYVLLASIMKHLGL